MIDASKPSATLKGLTREELLNVIDGLLTDRGPFEKEPARQVLALRAYHALAAREAAAREADDDTFGRYAEAQGKLQRGYSRAKSRKVEKTLAAWQRARSSYHRVRALRGRFFDAAFRSEP